MALTLSEVYTYLTRRLDVERAGTDLPPHLVAAHAADRAVIHVRFRPKKIKSESNLNPGREMKWKNSVELVAKR